MVDFEDIRNRTVSAIDYIENMETRIAILETSVPKIEKNTDRILMILEGSPGVDGLKTQVSLNKVSISRIWKTICAIGTACFGIISSVLIKVFAGG